MSDALDRHLTGALERLGIEVDEDELALMRAVDSVYGAALAALTDPAVGSLPAEVDLDPGRAPR